MKCIIIGAGNFQNEIITKEKEDLLICADAGYSHVKDMNLDIDLIVGDFDSLCNIPANVNIYKLPKEKDETDLFVATEEGMKKGYTEFHIYGALGGRIEHSIANIQILSNLTTRNIKAKLFDRNTIIEVLSLGTHIYSEEMNGYISLFSLTEESIISINHLKYELQNKVITNLFPLGIDNEFIGRVATINIHKGLVLSIINKKNA